MKVVDYLHALLDKKRGSADDLKRRVSRYPDDGTLNDPSPFREPPLVRVLQSNMCSPSVVRMLLDRGASVHRGAPLTVAIRNCGAITEEIVRELLLCGADATELDKFGQSSVCHALQAGAPASVFRLLLDGGCFPDLCRNHVSVLHCASFRPESGLSVDVFRLLLDAGANVLVAGSSGQSPLCFALRGGLDAAGLRLMLDAGVSVDACGRHASSLVCATDQGWGRTLRADVVRTLLLAGAATECVNGNGWAPLHLALR
ncbi:hypothetical protein JTE90_008320 [Oedothorax gibbosus]|uniref:Alpha-latrotoxin n=1 Tax=Oedothorax gibbosus TaxID=931172 RepID=A0AAV6TUN1_9ARAC|nr:hypothetical protein JTE90_008320 [Oedothorax gibbosus]